ncbi:hypothetical protein [Candidatus Enterococcus ferrettii]|uniref:Lipoprotein n=1 Tax=Candidatus Enterococcus ferrettii TaxID=2815324 RepID=A0ABV0ESL1_9ENTE|nr:hypothetical protein [Enterococcus sp. 665A]MBO1342384.1 hypothetical protein [Enterococcus sp. 665A]
MKKFALGKCLLFMVLTISIVALSACGEEKPNIRNILIENSDKWQLVSEQGSVEMIFGGNGIAELSNDNGEGQATYEINERQTEIELQFMQEIYSIKSGTMKNIQVENDKLILGDYTEKDSESSIPIRLEK